MVNMAIYKLLQVKITTNVKEYVRPTAFVENKHTEGIRDYND